MKIERFEIPGLAQYSYVISSQGKAIVVDAIRDVDRYLAYAAKNGLQITHVADTHIHADFASGSIALAALTGAELALSAHDRGELYESAMPHRPLHDGDKIEIGTVVLQALHTPGHTPEHISFIVFDTERGPTEPLALLSGDFLFVGSVGRPDLLGDEAKIGLANQLFSSLHERIAHLPDAIEVLPGHGAGSFCGSGMSDRPESTLGYERATNPLFKLSREAFGAEILASVPAMPRYYPRMKTLNAAGAPLLPALPGANPLTPAAVQRLKTEGAILLDLRRPEAFGGAHVPGAINIGAGRSLSLWAGWLLDSTRAIVLISEAGHEAGDDEPSRRALVRVGLDRLAGFLASGMPAWIDAGLDIARTPQLSTDEVQHSNQPILDVRTNREWQNGRIAGAQHIVLEDLEQNSPHLPQDRPLIVVCGSGYRSNIAASLLAQRGFAQVSSMAGGMAAWTARNLPLSTH